MKPASDSPLIDLAPASGPGAGQLALFLGLLLLGLGPLLPRLAKFHGDEIYYTDAAIQMVQRGDYWVPRYADGRERFLKPIVTYWAIAASYHLLGISYVASRLPFLLAGGLVLLLTWRLGLAVFGQRQSALLAAFIAGSNVQLLTLSLRSTPDILVSLFTLMSLLGFARILFQGDRSLSAYLLAYVGTGLAVETKGLLGLAPLAFVLLLRGATARHGTFGSSPLFEWRSVVLGVAVGLFWYLAVAGRHGETVTSQFFHDQVTAKVGWNPLRIVGNALAYLWAGLRHFLPWTLLIALGTFVARGPARAFLRAHRREAWFLGGFFLFLALIFSFSSMRRTRYLVIGYPLLSLLYAHWLTTLLKVPSVQRLTTRFVRVLAAAILVGGVLLCLGGLRLDWGMAIGGGLLAAVAVITLGLEGQTGARQHGFAVALIALAAFSVVENFVRPVFSRPPAPALAAALLQCSAEGRDWYAWKPGRSYPSQIQVLSGGRVKVQPVSLDAVDAARRRLSPIILTESQTNDWAAAGYQFERIADASRPWSSRDLRRLLTHPEPKQLLQQHVTGYYLATPQGNAGP